MIRPKKKGAASAVPRTYARAKLQSGGNRSLVLYGQPFTGKTNCVNQLVRDGYDVHYVDFDFNTLSIADVADADNFHYYPVSNGNTGGMFKWLRQLQLKGTAEACLKHNLLNCSVCGSSGEPFTKIDMMSMTANSIVVYDSYSSLVNSIHEAAVSRNNLSDLEILESDMSYHRAVSAVAVPLWNFVTKQPGLASSLVITHEYNPKNFMNKDTVKSFNHPVAGSGSFSGSDKAKSSPTAVWHTTSQRVADKRMPDLSSTASSYAKTPNEELYKNLLLPEAVSKFFHRENS